MVRYASLTHPTALLALADDDYFSWLDPIEFQILQTYSFIPGVLRVSALL